MIHGKTFQEKNARPDYGRPICGPIKEKVLS
jgi:hypothetical protein